VESSGKRDEVQERELCHLAAQEVAHGESGHAEFGYLISGFGKPDQERSATGVHREEEVTGGPP
jgi:hypothetical protein